MSNNNKDYDKTHWVDDKSVTTCSNPECNTPFSLTERRHHCRQCGKIFCGDCCFYRCPSEKRPTKPSRVCLDCLMNIAYEKTGVSREEPMQKQKCAVVGVNSSESFKQVELQSDDSHPGITGEANAKFDLEECYVDWIKKDSNGTIILTSCLITGDVAMEIGGNNKIELRKCIVLGTTIAAHLTANVKMDAWDTFFIAIGVPKGVRGTALRLEANAKAHCHRCTIIGSDGVLATSNSKIEAKDCLITCQKSKVPGYAPHSAVAGKHELTSTTINGNVKDKASDPDPITKVGKSAFKALRHVPGVGHAARVV